MAPEELTAALAKVVGTGQVITDSGVRGSYERDWTGPFGGEAVCVVSPADLAEVGVVLEVVVVLEVCGRAGVAGCSVLIAFRQKSSAPKGLNS